jgi:hypothetical protein
MYLSQPFLARRLAAEGWNLAKLAVRVPDQLRTGIEVCTYVAIEMFFNMRNEVLAAGKLVLRREGNFTPSSSPIVCRRIS